MEMLSEDGAISCGIMAGGTEQSRERGGLAPDVIRRAILGTFGVDTSGRVPKSFLHILHHLPCFVCVKSGSGQPAVASLCCGDGATTSKSRAQADGNCEQEATNSNRF